MKIEGKYSLDKKDAFGELKILQNNKFDYRYAIGLIDTKSKGTWEIKGDYLILTSDSKYESNKIEVKELNNNEKPKISIQFEDNFPAIKTELFINNDSTKIYTTNEIGEISLPSDKEILNFTVYYLGESYNYKVSNGKSFFIKLFPDDLSKTYFNKRKYKLRENKFIDVEYNWKYRRNKKTPTNNHYN